jgi:hypothetical protein
MKDIKIRTPQFTRIDGKIVNAPNEKEWDFIINDASQEQLIELGCQLMEENEGKTLLLFPGEWYEFIPNGSKLIDIFWSAEVFEKGVTDDDIRYGALAYGVVR